MKPDGFEQVELGNLTRGLQLCFRTDPPCGYRDGKHRIREMVMRLYDCGPDRAQRLVNHLEKEGYITLVDKRGKRVRSKRGKRRKSAQPSVPASARWRFKPLAVRPRA
jgi:hypothetical protein